MSKTKIREEVQSGFLWFPKTINGEWRWLTQNTWLTYVYSKFSPALGHSVLSNEDIKWLDKLEGVRNKDNLPLCLYPNPF